MIQDGKKFKRLEDDIWEFKDNALQLRATCFFSPDRTVYIATIFHKKEDDTDPREIKIAKQVRLDHLNNASSQSRREKPKQ